jgi:hypothetical protein
LWLFWPGSVVGLVLGLVALKQIRARHQGGRGIAIAGIVLSTLWLLIRRLPLQDHAGTAVNRMTLIPQAPTCMRIPSSHRPGTTG